MSLHMIQCIKHSFPSMGKAPGLTGQDNPTCTISREFCPYDEFTRELKFLHTYVLLRGSCRFFILRSKCSQCIHHTKVVEVSSSRYSMS